MTDIHIVCPECGSDHLFQVGRRSKKKNPVFTFTCLKCGNYFPLQNKHSMKIVKDTLVSEKFLNQTPQGVPA